MIHVGSLANLALQKFKAGTISIWQRRGSGLVLGGVWCGVLAASFHPSPTEPTPQGPQERLCQAAQSQVSHPAPRISHNPAVNNQGQELGRNMPLP